MTNRIVRIAVLAGSLGGLCAAASGCATVTSSQPGFTSATGEAWYTEAVGFMGMTWGSRTYYCPPPAQGPATCKEAKMVALAKEEVEAQKQAEKVASAK